MSGFQPFSLQFLDNAFCLAFGSPLAIEPCREAVNDSHQVSNQVLFVVLCNIHDLNRSALCLKQGFQIVESETSETVTMFYDVRGDARIFDLLMQHSEIVEQGLLSSRSMQVFPPQKY